MTTIAPISPPALVTKEQAIFANDDVRSLFSPTNGRISISSYSYKPDILHIAKLAKFGNIENRLYAAVKLFERNHAKALLRKI